MALISCGECGKQVSDTAPASPNCGAPIRTAAVVAPVTAKPSRRGPVIGLVVLGVALIGGVFAYTSMQERDREARRADIAAADARQQEIRRAAAEAEANRKAEEERRKAEERAQILKDPTPYLAVSELAFFDKGIINSYRQLTGFSLENKSPFHLKNLKGSVDWINSQGESVGSTPFSLKGSLASGDTKRFDVTSGTLKSGTIEASANQVKLRFQSASAVE